MPWLVRVVYGYDYELRRGSAIVLRRGMRAAGARLGEDLSRSPSGGPGCGSSRTASRPRCSCRSCSRSGPHGRDRRERRDPGLVRRLRRHVDRVACLLRREARSLSQRAASRSPREGPGRLDLAPRRRRAREPRSRCGVLPAAGVTTSRSRHGPEAPASEPYPVGGRAAGCPGRPPPHGLLLVARRARRVDVVYTTGMFGRSGLIAGRAPAARRQAHRRSGLRAARHAGRRRRRRLRTKRRRRGCRPARRRCATWCSAGRRTSTFPAPSAAERAVSGRRVGRSRCCRTPRRLVARRATSCGGGTARRIRARLRGPATAQKSLDVALDAVSQVDGVTLTIVGDGEERPRVAALVVEHRLE